MLPLPRKPLTEVGPLLCSNWLSAVPAPWIIKKDAQNDTLLNSMLGHLLLNKFVRPIISRCVSPFHRTRPRHKLPEQP